MASSWARRRDGMVSRRSADWEARLGEDGLTAWMTAVLQYATGTIPVLPLLLLSLGLQSSHAWLSGGLIALLLAWFVSFGVAAILSSRRMTRLVLARYGLPPRATRPLSPSVLGSPAGFDTWLAHEQDEVAHASGASHGPVTARPFVRPNRRLRLVAALFCWFGALAMLVLAVAHK